MTLLSSLIIAAADCCQNARGKLLQGQSYKALHSLVSPFAPPGLDDKTPSLLFDNSSARRADP